MMPDAAGFGDRFAAVYDDTPHGDRAITTHQLQALEGLADGGEVAELGVGTGLVALPLALRGVRVFGVDASQAMLNRLRSKMSPDLRLELACLDVTKDPLPRKFKLIYLSLNTLFNLGPMAAQRDCLSLCCDSLSPGGHLAIETFLASPGNLPTSRSWVGVTRMTDDDLILQALLFHEDEQVLQFQDIVFTGGGVALYPSTIHYHTPQQLDDMARAVGLEMVDRWGSWAGEPVKSTSEEVIHIYAQRETLQ